MVRPDLFGGENDMNSIPRFRVRPVKKHLHACRVTMNEPGLFESLACGRQISPAQNDVHVLCISHRRLIHARNPRSHGISTNNGV